MANPLEKYITDRGEMSEEVAIQRLLAAQFDAELARMMRDESYTQNNLPFAKQITDLTENDILSITGVIGGTMESSQYGTTIVGTPATNLAMSFLKDDYSRLIRVSLGTQLIDFSSKAVAVRGRGSFSLVQSLPNYFPKGPLYQILTVSPSTANHTHDTQIELLYNPTHELHLAKALDVLDP